MALLQTIKNIFKKEEEKEVKITLQDYIDYYSEKLPKGSKVWINYWFDTANDMRGGVEAEVISEPFYGQNGVTSGIVILVKDESGVKRAVKAHKINKI